MRHACFVLALLLVTGAAVAASAQPIDPLSPLALSVACAPPPSAEGAPADALRIIGSQDPIPRTMFGDRDLLVIGGGTTAGVELGRQFFLRRTITFASSEPRGSKTVGWIHVVAVNESTAIAVVDHVCNAIMIDDYLAPYAAPVVSADVEKDEAPGQPDFNLLGHILTGNEDRQAVGAGDLVLIDWGVDKGMTPGARFAIYRDVGAAGLPLKGLPLSSIGEGIVISIGSNMALSRVTRARDAIYSGDYIALRR